MKNVAVIGAGITGITLANLLQKNLILLYLKNLEVLVVGWQQEERSLINLIMAHSILK